jgi:hypothetical protein
MNTVSDSNPQIREVLTEVVDDVQQLSVLSVIVDFLASNGVENVNVEFGFVVDRDLRGETQGEDAVVPLMKLQQFIERGLSEGTIEWSGTSDFRFSPIGLKLQFMLCNDSDLHFSSANPTLLSELTRMLRASGVKVYE